MTIASDENFPNPNSNPNPNQLQGQLFEHRKNCVFRRLKVQLASSLQQSQARTAKSGNFESDF